MCTALIRLESRLSMNVLLYEYSLRICPRSEQQQQQKTVSFFRSVCSEHRFIALLVQAGAAYDAERCVA